MEFDGIRRCLGNPTYEDDSVILYCGDSLQLMRKLNNDLIPLTITSPPYNIGKEYEHVRSLNEYLEWMSTWIERVYYLTAKDGAFWLNLGYISIPGRANAIPIPYLLWDRIPFFLIQEVVWNYGAGVAARKFLSPRNEKFLWYVKNENDYVFNLDEIRDPNVKYPNQKKNGKLKCNPLGKNPTDVWRIPKVTSGANRASKERTNHPAQFPLELVQRIIRASSQTDDLIFDPFAGSGSVLEAALFTGRKALGIEIEPRYIDIAVRRLKSAKSRIDAIASQGTLFDSVSV